jgi:hypothetical protein
MFPLHHRVQNGSGAHPASYPMGTSGSFTGVKQPGCEADHPSLSSDDVKNAWSYTSTPPFIFMMWCLVKHRDKFTFIFMYSVVSVYPHNSNILFSILCAVILQLFHCLITHLVSRTQT